MTRLQFAVVEIAGSWRILMNGERIGGFAEQAEALQCATDAAASAKANGVEVEVLLQDFCGEVQRLPLGGSA